MATAGLPIPTFQHDKQARLDYPIDWTDWLAAVNDTISVSTWTGSPELILEDDTFTPTAAVVWVSADQDDAIEGTKYFITNHIITVAGREEDQTIKLKIKQR